MYCSGDTGLNHNSTSSYRNPHYILLHRYIGPLLPRDLGTLDPGTVPGFAV